MSAPQPGFLEAVARARQVAEKMQQQKRSLDSGAEEDSVKKPRADGLLGFASQSYSPPSSNSYSESSNQGTVDPLQKVKEVAARLNQQVAGLKPGPAMMFDGAGVQDEFWVPERLVGLVIGKGGETISRLQAESGAHMQVDQLNNGGPERRCMLSGPKDAVERIKSMLRQLVDRGKAGPGGGMGGLPSGQTVEEVMIPGNLVGIVIGKGGEQIKQIQEQCGVKMVLIQESHEVSQSGKPLRITGDPERVRNAKDVVLRILAQKEEQDRNKMGGGGRGRGRGGYPPPLFGLNGAGVGEYGTPQEGGYSNAVAGAYRSTRVEVPNAVVGGIIGKSGEMIRRISQDFGSVKMQFANDADPSTGMKVLEIGPGPSQAVDDCANTVRKLVDAMHNAKNNGGRQSTDAVALYQQIRQDHPAGNNYGQTAAPGFSGPDPSKLGPYEQTEIFFPIPFRKAGYVIGKGGATIHEIIRESGAHVEVLRDVNEKELAANGHQPETKTFRIKGMVSQIEAALRIITEKAGVPPPPGWCAQPQDLASLYAYSLASSGTTDAAAAAVAAAVDPSYWYQYQQPQNGSGGAPAYQSAQPASQPAPDSQQMGGASAAASYPTPTINPSTGQPDYSEAWAQYYRSLGQHEYADMILAQARGGGGASSESTGNQQQPSSGYPGYQQPGGPQQPYMAQAQPQMSGPMANQQH